MLALVNYGHEPDSLELREVPEPILGADQVLLDVKAVAICGSDVHVQKGHASWLMDRPVTLGHEFSGIVRETGRDVIGFRAGDRVVSETAAFIDPTAIWARTGLYNLDPCRRGFGARADGAMAERVVVPARCLHALPDSIDFEIGSLIEPLCVAYQAVQVQSRVGVGDAVVVLGAGPIGLLTAWLARTAGARHVLVVGLPSDQSRVEVARHLGIEQIFGPGDVTANLLDVAPNGADLVVDATGASASLQLGLQLVKPAGQITKVGWGPEPLGYSLDLLVAKAITLRGSFSHTWAVWERAIALAEAHPDELRALVGWRGNLSAWADGFALQASGAIVKGVLSPALY